jgi:hypothetical protein
MKPREKPDSYGEWAIGKVQQEAEENGSPLPAEVLTAAHVVWPSAAALVANELKREGSGREAGKRGFSNEVGRGKSFFLRCWPLPGTPVR